MEAPPQNVAEVATTFFTKLQKQMTNDKQINYISQYFNSFHDLAFTQPLSHVADQVQLNIYNVNALPISYK
jgi:hypothetical protein